MKIIDAHLSFVPDSEYLSQLAIESGHQNSAEYLIKIYRDLGIERGIVMGTPSLEFKRYPRFLSYCVGLDNCEWKAQDWQKNLELIEKHLRNRECVGIKLYPGYWDFFIDDESLAPIYKLAEKFNKPIAIHAGLTSNENFDVPIFCSPEVFRKAAEKFPNNRFVMCHFAQPLFRQAARLMKKFPNIATDLSGILEGQMSVKSFDENYLWIFRDSLELIGDFDRIMFGTDFPLANIQNCIEFVKSIVPKSEWEKVFYYNAVKIYNLR